MPSVSGSLESAVRCHELGNWEQAEQLYRQMIHLDSNHAHIADAHFNLARMLKERGNIAEAVEQYQQVVTIRPGDATAMFELAGSLHDSGKLDEAVATYQRLFIINPNIVKAQNNLGNVFREQHKLDEAVCCYRRAIQLNPEIASVHNSLGNVLKDQEKFDEAIACFDRALNLEPNFAAVFCNKGATFEAMQQFDRAIDCYDRAIEIDPNQIAVYRNRGNSLKSLQRFDESLESYDRALTIDSNDADAHFNRSLVWLSQGDFARGWREYEWRHLRTKKKRVGCGCKQWDGSSLSDRTILVYAEQGIGDEIMFASCLCEVIDQAASCLIDCDPRLVTLFSRSFPSAHVFGMPILHNPAAQELLRSVDVEISIGSLPQYVRPSRKSFSPRQSYLSADPRLKEKWQSRLANLGNGLKVGISWQGGKSPSVRRIKSAQLDEWRPLFDIPGVSFINLQYGDCANEISTIQQSTGVTIHDWPDVDRWNDLDDLAAQISELDLVISIDNTTVHLAGALGVETWTLLPFATDWRWFVDSEESLWYSTMRLVRQPSPGDWNYVFTQVAKLLCYIAAKRTGED